MAPALAASSTSTVYVVDDGLLGGGTADGPLAEAGRIFARLSKRTNDPSHGVLDPHDINNAGFIFLFALIGVAFVCTGIWFFFWAKNGGFHFKEDDWDDYKSTVLRRKGPNGTVLSGATKSTNLGGGSVYKGYDDDGMTVVTESTALSGVTAGASDIFAREKRKEKQEKREAERRKRRGEEKNKEKKKKKKKQKSSRQFGDDGVLDEEAEKLAQDQLRSYRHERPARVGGLNKESEGSNWDGSTNPTESSVGASAVSAASELLSNRQSTPTSTPAGTPTKTPKSGGIRKVYSTMDRNANREKERIRVEARRLREEGKVSRRDFGYQRAAGALSQTQLSESLLLSGSGSGGSSTVTTGSTLDGTASDLGTKSYHHPMPELREQRKQEREERRARRGGYRRGNNEDSEI